MVLIAAALALPTVEEGPWNVSQCVDSGGTCTAGTSFGEVFATDAGTGASWNEITERGAGWSWVTATTAWYITVPASAALECSSAVCQRVGVVTQDSFRPKAGMVVLPGQAVSMTEYHAVGKYEITAWVGTTPKVAYYYVADAGNNTRTERLCSPSGFKWPSKSIPAVTWRVKLLTAGAATEACPMFWKKTELTVSL